jgi:hypothetical protein
MATLDRRGFLGTIGAGALAGQAVGRAQTAPTGRDLAGLAELVRATPRAELPAKALELARTGVDWRDLLGACFLAGIRDVEPHPVGFQFHCVMMTSSAFQIARQAPAAERMAAVLFNLDDFKVSQAVDAERGDWTLPAPPDVSDTDAESAASRLATALGAWDRDGADRAATALARTGDLDRAFEPLWWFGARDFTNIGHNPIFVAQSHRTLQEIGWRHGEDVLRSLVRGLLDGEPGALDATFEANRELANELVVPAPGETSAAVPGDVLSELRSADTEAAAKMVATLLRAGVAPGSVLDGLRLFAVEQLWRDPGVFAVHALTSVNALRHAAVHASSPRTRALVLLQAASWLVLYRDFLGRRPAYARDLPGVDELAPAEAVATADEVFEAAGEDARAAAPIALRAAKDGIAPLRAGVRHWLLRKVRDHHDYKFAAALLEEMELASVATAPRLLAASFGYLRTPAGRNHPLWERLSG